MDLQFLVNHNQNICYPLNESEVVYFNFDNFTFFNLFKFFSSLFSGFLLAFIFISTFLYYPSKLKFEKLYKKNKEIYDYDSFLITSLDEYYNLQEDKNDDYLKSLIYRYIYYTFDFRDKKYYIIIKNIMF